jgi:hypothetical protein
LGHDIKNPFRTQNKTRAQHTFQKQRAHIARQRTTILFLKSDSTHVFLHAPTHSCCHF